MEMTSRERVFAALEHRETDRVPVDFSGHRSSGIAALVYPDLRKHLGLPAKSIRVYDMVQQLAIVDEDVLDCLGVDTIEMGRGFLLEDKDWKDWTLPDGTPCLIPGYIHVDKRGDDWFLLNDSGQELAVQKKGFLYLNRGIIRSIADGMHNNSFFPVYLRNPMELKIQLRDLEKICEEEKEKH